MQSASHSLRCTQRSLQTPQRRKQRRTRSVRMAPRPSPSGSGVGGSVRVSTFWKKLLSASS
jgi:hypothetical protein